MSLLGTPAATHPRERSRNLSHLVPIHIIITTTALSQFTLHDYHPRHNYFFFSSLPWYASTNFQYYFFSSPFPQVSPISLAITSPDFMSLHVISRSSLESIPQVFQ